ncbi:hypothetical protein GLOIN_2v1485894 [Rhizophagus irregularis DAOM 181602=DAOM 197198]|uniref:Uncharacterized protein n=1 Tax=Rhizophagus irregularis (strain DAOM 181602 / DAOM 197198 / MUCL 43194) TaxID=747089 RepID=A0A2P4P927_RHIID|nr:hypothetical protein GLOIN_2v1485894 [Rhizophagus irregularis DAOM 181602=DAOM 197198]POG61896.1 hypothetical protein GLOIN_2v1485894 [Rhizophagus irregularis DAOM 181602=DAOM 197198]|eukprot:XP_025168762.1 hypothetical protein GLOIN_2v1485894 [Rhizophagus irregularis DAOM 181602=DAOM 197198]
MQSIDSLRELNSKLLAEISELMKVNAELKDKNAEIPDLKRKFAEIESEKVELKARIAEILRQAVEENQLSMATHHEKPLVDKKMDTSLPEELIPEVIAKQSVSAVNISVMDQCDQTTLEDKETNAFLDEVRKKKISDEIRQRNRKKKLQA